MADPSVSAALGLGWRAAIRNAWLAPVGLVAGLARSALYLPLLAFGWFAVMSGAARGLREAMRPDAVAAGALQAVTAPRVAAVLLGLWGAAALLAAAVRLAWLAGALPMLGRTLSGEDEGAPVFATGVAYGFPRLAGTAFLAWLLELLGAAFAGVVAVGSLAISLRVRELGWGPGAAALVAAALTCAVLVPLFLGTVGDAALGRAALRGEHPGRALGRAALRVARRPAVFLLAALVVAAFGGLAAASIHSLASLATGFARGRAAWLALGPDLVVAVAAALVAAWVELWRLGTLSALACTED